MFVELKGNRLQLHLCRKQPIGSPSLAPAWQGYKSFQGQTWAFAQATDNQALNLSVCLPQLAGTYLLACLADLRCWLNRFPTAGHHLSHQDFLSSPSRLLSPLLRAL